MVIIMDLSAVCGMIFKILDNLFTTKQTFNSKSFILHGDTKRHKMFMFTINYTKATFHWFFLSNTKIFRYIKITLIINIETYKEITQLVSTSNKRSSSGKMKIDLKRVGLHRERDLTPN